MLSEAASPNAVELIDHLYAALFREAPWEDFATRSCNLLPNGKSVTFYHDANSGAGAFSLTAGLDAGMAKGYDDYYNRINPWIDHALVRPLGRVTQADELLSREKLRRTEFFQEYLRPQDIETGLGVTLHRHDGLHVFFSLVSADATDDQIACARHTIAALVPHLSRALCIRDDQAAMMGRAPQGGGSILQVDARLRVIAADDGALSLLAQTEALRIGAMGRLICTDAGFLSCLQYLLNTKTPPAVHYRYLKRTAGALPLHACLYRPGPAGSTGPVGDCCLVRLEDPSLTVPEGMRGFVTMHGLTSAEAGIVSGLLTGLTLAQIATRRGTSQATVRTQMKEIFRKTGCTRQADVICQVAVMARSHGPSIAAPLVIRPPSRVRHADG